MDKFTELADKLFNNASILVDKYGSNTVELGLEMFRWMAIGNILEGVAVLIVALSLGFLAKYIYEKRRESYEELSIVASVISALNGVILLIFSFLILVNSWNYIGVFRPDLYAAKQIYEKSLGRK